ncbi:hypothetical protein LCGC14_3085310, partial [marine sediment metagenome]
ESSSKKLKTAKKQFELSQAHKIAKEKLVDSVASVLKSLR